MSYYTYILQSLANETYYIGSSKDFGKRLRHHNLGYSDYTKKFRPWKLVFIREFPNKSSAYKFEMKLKGLKKNSQLEKLIREVGGPEKL